MGLFNVFRLPKHNKFNYIPRHYDPEKEAFKERMREIELRSGDSTEAMKSRIAAGMRQSAIDNSGLRRKSIIKSNMIVLITIIVLVFLSIIFINYYLPRILESL